ncbi:hypothetical protein GX50_07728 [[Emmonsia] crescens]|uniref:Uncharacterized protein n=1 Tax=[Emmonsia] crescens TaxID=73230 RepID=A0A2B7Z8J8_9EURO|nr:hypothetical protein GX50_07728 [Emmonsia crescens]
MVYLRTPASIYPISGALASCTRAPVSTTPSPTGDSARKSGWTKKLLIITFPSSVVMPDPPLDEDPSDDDVEEDSDHEDSESGEGVSEPE